MVQFSHNVIPMMKFNVAFIISSMLENRSLSTMNQFSDGMTVYWIRNLPVTGKTNSMEKN